MKRMKHMEQMKANVKKRQGFTLVELLLVVVVVGILTATAVPKLSGAKSSAYVATMRSDLKNLVVSAESHYADNGTYAGLTVTDLQSPDVTITYTADGALGWAATAAHTGTSVECTVGIGSSRPVGSAEGSVTCE